MTAPMSPIPTPPAAPKKSHKVRNFVVLPLAAIAVIGIIGAAVGGGTPEPAAAANTAPATTSSTATPADTPAEPVEAPAAPVETPAEEAPLDMDLDTSHTVRYEITGSGTGMLTYISDANMGMAQDTSASLPWSKELTLDEATFVPVSLSVQHSSGSGPVTCKILIDDEVISENTATGQYAIASCNGQL